ncbi:hypothetical protein MLD38_025908 [Melastoma candidum]|uniref:Uncharacterized protein n=1 Tax=Melastoma candidum TaxID=119954 RepID=A0ACB9P021_9MYRT|nr:hypothetical protein MLD38_025908 [Melastoma candidum]
MEKKGVLEEIKVEEKSLETEEEEARKVESEKAESHPYAFHVSGPRNVSSPNWRDLISSSWKDENYKRTVMACFIQGVYLLELDRQENRMGADVLAPKWWLPFKYKLSRTLVDERDGSIFGALLEWDRSAALADLVLIRPSGAPRAVLALRGTLLKSPTIRRDIQDDLRFLAWESLKGSVRFGIALEALRSVAESYGSNNVCIAGHSLGAGFALQVGKALAKEGLFVDAHLFNPPSVSIAMSLRSMGEKAGIAWQRVRSMFPQKDEGQSLKDPAPGEMGLMNWLPRLHWNKAPNSGLRKWVPHLYVNDSDYICCHYSQADQQSEAPAGVDHGKENFRPGNNGQVAAKLFVTSKGKQRFMEAHGLEQWWSEGLQLQMALNNSRLINRQLKSLYPDNINNTK